MTATARVISIANCCLPNGCRWCARRTIRAPAAVSRSSPSCAANAGSLFPWCREGARSRLRMCLRCFTTLGLGEVDWTPVDSLTAQKRLVEAGLGIALLSESNAADELRYKTISTIDVRDLKARHDVVTITRRGGFLSAAARRLMDIVRGEYRG